MSLTHHSIDFIRLQMPDEMPFDVRTLPYHVSICRFIH